jgi:septum formation protein
VSSKFQVSSLKFPAIILASSSPRRREFLKQLGIPFKIVVPRVDEQPEKGEEPGHFAWRLAVDKALDVASRFPGKSIVIAADTIVVLGKTILGKPKDAADAQRMLKMLSGREHEVITGVCVMSGKKKKSFVTSTDVVFKKLTKQEIDFYIASGEPMDKAGAYAIQGIGSFLVREIRGSYTNVVGLPVAELLDVLETAFKVPLFGKTSVQSPKSQVQGATQETLDLGL